MKTYLPTCWILSKYWYQQQYVGRSYWYWRFKHLDWVNL